MARYLFVGRRQPPGSPRHRGKEAHDVHPARVHAGLLGLTGFALVFLPWEDKREILDPVVRSILFGALIGAFVGGFALHRHFGAPRFAGWMRSMTAYVAAVILGGAVGGVIALPAPLPLGGLTLGPMMALIFTLGLPIDDG